MKWTTVAPTQIITSGADIAGEITATLAVASITFKDDYSYSNKILQDAASTHLRG